MDGKIKRIESAAQMKAILEPIPAENFITNSYGYSSGKHCSLGHINTFITGDERMAGTDCNGFGAQVIVDKFLREKHSISNGHIVTVNDYNYVNGYNEDTPKERIMHLIEDMIKAGY